MNHRDLEDEVRTLRKKLNELYLQNKNLEQQISKVRSEAQEEFERAKSKEKEHEFLQKTLHSYVGSWAVIKKGILEVHFNPSFEADIFGGQYEIIFSTRDKIWKVLGCRLPHSMCTKVEHKVLHSLEELTAFVQGMKREIQAFIQRKIQVQAAERILEQGVRPVDIWYSISVQQVNLSLPMRETDTIWEIQLQYESHHCLPDKVTTNAEGVEQSKLEKMHKRMDLLFKSYPLQSILEQEFGSVSQCEGSIISESILGQLESP